MVAERNPQIEKAVVRLRRLSADERARDLYERREKGRRDHVSLVKFEREKGERKGLLRGKREGVKEGLQRGLLEGERKGKLDMARQLMEFGDPVDKIMLVTGLSREEIEQLKSWPPKILSAYPPKKPQNPPFKGRVLDAVKP